MKKTIQDGGTSKIENSTVQRYQSMVCKGIRSTCTNVGEMNISILRKYVVPFSESVRAQQLDFAEQEPEESVIERKNVKRAAKIVRRKALRKHLGCYSKQRRMFPEKSADKRSVGFLQELLQTFLVDHVISKIFAVPILCGSSRSFWRERPRCCRCLVGPRARALSYLFFQKKSKSMIFN